MSPTLLLLAIGQTAPQELPANPSGSLVGIARDGKTSVECPLEKTKAHAEIAGFGARVTVEQTFCNASKTPIEAVYTFPLPADAAVDRMVLVIGNRRIDGSIKRREEARAIFDAAKNEGRIASLLDQERPNIFTQSVANIMPGAKVKVEISYVQLLNFQDGKFEFTYPMVVGPRYLAHTADPNAISPPTLSPGVRSGTNVELTVNIDAGTAIGEVQSTLHQVTVRRGNDKRLASVSLTKRDEIPNRDFILRYAANANEVQGALLTHVNDKNQGYFALMLMPPKAPSVTQIAPKEMVFVIDQSGSQNGFPIEKSKEVTIKLIEKLNPNDTFNVLGFSSTVNPLWPAPVPNTKQNRDRAIEWIKGITANGGTELRRAVDAAFQSATDPQRLRYVVFNTDGFVGNEKEILQVIQQSRGTSRLFAFGIGNSVNRFLIDAMSLEGRGDSEIVTLAESADAAVSRFVRRSTSPVLTQVDAQFYGQGVSEVYPKVLPDVFSERPVVIRGRFVPGSEVEVEVRGISGGEQWSKRIPMDLPRSKSGSSALANVWARAKIEDLSRNNYMATVSGKEANPVAEAITSLGLEYGLMTEYTSFVAVEEKVVNVGGKQRTVRVPVDMADGVNMPGQGDRFAANSRKQLSLGMPAMRAGGAGGGSGAPGSVAAPTTAAGKPAAGEMADATLRARTGADLKKWNYEQKVAKALRDSKSATVEVRVILSKWEAKLLAQLKSAGLKVEDQDQGLLSVFGTISRAKLESLAQFDWVRFVDKLS